jgi:hypothetical protein
LVLVGVFGLVFVAGEELVVGDEFFVLQESAVDFE